MENPIKMDDLGGNPLFLETSISNMYDFDDFSIVFSFVRQKRLLILVGSDDVNVNNLCICKCMILI